MNHFRDYVRHLYWKYEDQMTEWEKDGIWHGCGLSDIDHLMTDAEKAECARLWEQDFELGLVD